MPTDPSDILNAHQKKKTDAIAFFKELAHMNSGPISQNVINIDKNSKSLAETNLLFEKKLSEFSKSNMDSLAISRFCLALFFIERTNEIHNIVLTKNVGGLYSLYTSLRNQVCDLLNEKYYSASKDYILSFYLDLEPLLCASSDLCELPVPEITTIMETYKSKIADRLEKL
ncbi:MAG: hypothetical protein ABH842_04970 [Candidatus Micrarchaeota archaeon]